MSPVHGFFHLLPNWGGFIVLIAIWVIFRGILLRWRRSSMERMRLGGSMPTQTPVQPVMQPFKQPLMHGQVRCPRCAASVPGVAAFCPHCGLALNTLPPPILQGPFAQKRGRGGLLFLIYILLGVIGLAAFA